MAKSKLEHFIAELKEKISPKDPFAEVRERELSGLATPKTTSATASSPSQAPHAPTAKPAPPRAKRTPSSRQMARKPINRPVPLRMTQKREMIVGRSTEGGIPGTDTMEKIEDISYASGKDRASRLEKVLVTPLRSLRLRNKMIAVALPPLLVVAVIALLGIGDRWDSRSTALEANKIMEYATVNADLADHLRTESIYSTAYLAEGGDLWKDELDQTRALTDASKQRFLTIVDSFDINEINPLLETLNGNFVERLDSLDVNRTAITNRQIPVVQAVSQYGAALEASSRINSGITQGLTTPALAEIMNNVTSLARLENAIAWESSILVAVIEQGAFFTRAGEPCENVFAPECVSFQDAQVRNAETQSARSAFDIVVFSPEDRQALRDSEADQQYDNLTVRIYSAARSGEPVESAVVPDVGNTAAGTFIESSLSQLSLLSGIEKDFLKDGTVSADQALSSATQTIILFAGGTTIIAILALALAVLAARATARPLNHLTSAAQALATDQLPELVNSLKNPNKQPAGDVPFADRTEQTRQELEKISFESHDEVGELAEAFNSIQRVTVEVAEAQSELLRKGIGDIFVHLARRNQVLLDRQIASIEAMEQGEEDPDQLANLFKLDHLATRMRRNAESLLVLAGAETVRGRTGKPVVISDIIRLGMGEVESYQRVRMTQIDQVLIPANVARDLAHMLGELIENATQFSAPETFVDVQGKRNDNGTYHITVTDHGVGMTEEQLASANELLADPPMMGLSISRSLGFIVVSRLAARFGVHVNLATNPTGGVIATVLLPPSTLHESNTANVAPAEELVIEPAPPVAQPPQTTVTPMPPPAPVAQPVAKESRPMPSLADLPQPTSMPIVPTVVGSPSALPKRQPTSRKADLPPPSGRPFNPVGRSVESRVTNTKRKPEEIQDMLSRFRSGTVTAQQNKPLSDLQAPVGPPVAAAAPTVSAPVAETAPAQKAAPRKTPARKAPAKAPTAKTAPTKAAATKAPARKRAPAKKAATKPVAPAAGAALENDIIAPVEVGTMPPPTAPNPAKSTTSSKPLAKRTPKSRHQRTPVDRSGAVARSPEEVREALIQYRTGLRRDT